MCIQDVLIWNHHRGPKDDESGNDLLWYLKHRQFLNASGDLWVGHIDGTDMIMTACEPAGYRFSPHRQFSAYYAIVNERPSEPEEYRWDPDQRLVRVLAFSRLIHPTPTGYDYAARVRRDREGRVKQVILFGGLNAYSDEEREWLTRAEWNDVVKLINVYENTNGAACRRLHSAIWYREKLATEYYLDVRWVLLATALESIIGIWLVDRSRKRLPGVSRRFVVGVSRLADSCDVPFSESEAEIMWKRRSSLAHGQGWPVDSLREGEPSDDIHKRAEDLLNVAICKMIRDLSFRSHFVEDRALAKWLGF
ncbi:hypothetical protein B7486_07690 [cyanobacterium TDX16]|nr:hypothetical protein B7486_07690 [cyanobacterium TDX16]